MNSALPPGYSLRPGDRLDRALLVKFMQRTYQEFDPAAPTGHLALTVEQYFSNETPLWWVETVPELPLDGPLLRQTRRSTAIACLWMGTAVDQTWGDRHAHIFLLYVDPAHRRQGIGAALMHQAEQWAKHRGNRQIGLQVFCHNQPALALYQKLGFQTHSLWMTKSLEMPCEH